MYEVDSHDRVVEVESFPQSSVGAPLPMVFAQEHRLLLGYLVEAPDPSWDGRSIQLVDEDAVEPAAVIEFEGHEAHFLGPPNDEAFDGHPLAARGLQPYRNFVVENSSWIRTMERRNRVHDYHRPEDFTSKTHYVFAFHDSVFECVASSATATPHPGPLRAVATEMAHRLF